MLEKIGVYAGSFDPFTNGHLAVVKKAAKMLDKVIVVIGVSPEKKRRFPVEEMTVVILESLHDDQIFNVEVDFTEDLIAMYAKNKGANYLIRGLRSVVDYSSEEDLADKNERLSGIDTIFLRAGKNGYISSTYVMELLKRDYDVADLIPKSVLSIIQK